jgi:hypothetical protein
VTSSTSSAILPGFDSVNYPGNDDGTYPCGTSSAPIGCSPEAVTLPFSLNFFGHTYNAVYVNNNGNLTLDAPLDTYTPFPLSDPGTAIIAPFFADVDTRVGNTVNFGTGVVDGRQAFAVNWPGVGCYFENNRQVNNFQVVLIDRSDLGPGDFDIEFNYATVQWDSGTASGGDGDCRHGSAARAGYAGGSGATGTYFEIDGSGENDALLDSADFGLVHDSIGSEQLGRYVFPVRGGRPSITNGAPFKDAAIGEGETGRHRTVCEHADPVNCSSGNFYEAATDLLIGGLGPGLVLRRAYNSLESSTRGSMFGFGWSSSFGMNLTPHADGAVDVTSGDASQVTCCTGRSWWVHRPALGELDS